MEDIKKNKLAWTSGVEKYNIWNETIHRMGSTAFPTAEEKTSDFEDIAIESIQNEAERKVTF